MLTDLITLCGVACLLAGLYLWLGVPAPLIAGGALLLYAGIVRARQETIVEEKEHEHHETTITQ